MHFRTIELRKTRTLCEGVVSINWLFETDRNCIKEPSDKTVIYSFKYDDLGKVSEKEIKRLPSLFLLGLLGEWAPH